MKHPTMSTEPPGTALETAHDTPRVLRAVVYFDGELWVAQCLEVDLAISSRQRDELPNLVRNQLRGQAELDRQRDRAPFSASRPAPEAFHSLYVESEPWQEVHLDGSRADGTERLPHRGTGSVVALATSQRSPTALQRA
jgi:hypothetical protein